MPLLIPLICLAVAGSTASPAKFNPYEGPQPIAIVVQFDPGATVIGADMPRVAIYDTGKIIFRLRHEDQLVYQEARLSPETLAEVTSRIERLLGRSDVLPYYNLAGDITDQPETMVYLRSDGMRWVARVYGLAASDEATDPPQADHQAAPVDPLAHLLQLHTWLCNLRPSESHEWIPNYLEVMFWDFSYDREPAVPWPADWPAFDSARSVRRAELRSVFLDGPMLPALRDFLANLDGNRSVEIEGTKWAVSYRYVFPSEPVWREGFAAVDWSRFATPPVFDERPEARHPISLSTIGALAGMLILVAALCVLIYLRRRQPAAVR